LANATDWLGERSRRAAGVFRIRTGGIAGDHLARVFRVMRDRRVDLSLALERAGDQSFIAARDSSGANRVAQFFKSTAIARDQQRARGAVVQAMNQAAFERLLANCRGLGKTRDDRIHDSVALAGVQWMTGDAAGFVDDDHGRILVENFEREAGIWLDGRAAICGGNLDPILGADDLAFLRAATVDSHHPARDQLLRNAPRGREAGPHEVMIEAFFQRVGQGTSGSRQCRPESAWPAADCTRKTEGSRRKAEFRAELPR